MKMKKVVIGGAAVLTAAGIGLGAAQLANADSTTPQPTDSASVSAEDSQRSGRGGGKGMRGLDTAVLAEKLGVDETTLTEAIEAVRAAQAPTEKPSEGTTPTEEDRAAKQAEFAKALAEQLGIDEATVTTAVEELRAEAQAERAAADKAVLDQAVTDGTLTQEEADAVSKAADAGIVEIRGGGRK